MYAVALIISVQFISAVIFSEPHVLTPAHERIGSRWGGGGWAPVAPPGSANDMAACLPNPSSLFCENLMKKLDSG